jgi:apolipoprotein N-acyltransferase
MITILKFLLSFVVASAISVFSAALSLFVLKYIVDVFKLNYGKDAYWVFTIAFYVAIISWILSFFLTVIIIDR